jgi:ribokinase
VVIVFGSINLDLVSTVERFPAVGETVAGLSFAMLPGGKGANQALAAARAGALVRLYGAVGRDAFAQPAMALLAEAGVDIRGVTHVDAATGCATILVDAQGENCIVVIAGANAKADAGAIPDSMLASDALLVLQQEVPASANLDLLARARTAGTRTLLNAAPARPLRLDVLRHVDVLVVNEGEASALARYLGWPTPPQEFAAAAVATVPGLAVVVTLGAAGALWADAETCVRATAPHVRVVDTTGAGDAFVGALAAALDARIPEREALRGAVAAGSLPCTAHGAQSALPSRAAIEALLPSVTAADA